VPDSATPDQLFCEDTLPTTGRRCREPASIIVVRFGASSTYARLAHCVITFVSLVSALRKIQNEALPGEC
jgi:hypothetical protein